MTKVVGFLQNAWSPMYAGETWPRHSWLKALHACRSGQRLRIMTDSMIDIDIWYDNTTPIVGPTPNSIVKPDTNHIKAVLLEQKPDLVILFGKQAKSAVMPLWNKSTLIVPHPACRVLTNELYKRAATLFNEGYLKNKVVELIQNKTGLEVIEQLCLQKI